MPLSLVTVAFDPETGTFPPDPLASLDGDPLSVAEHFFHHGGLPYLLLVVHHQPPKGMGRPQARKRTRENPADKLHEKDRQLYERLRAWRLSRAEADGVPVYVILNNRQLTAIAQRRPRNLSELREIDGIGEAKLGHYGKAVLRILESELVVWEERS